MCRHNTTSSLTTPSATKERSNSIGELIVRPEACFNVQAVGHGEPFMYLTLEYNRTLTQGSTKSLAHSIDAY
jgi:hypothetical protein